MLDDTDSLDPFPPTILYLNCWPHMKEMLKKWLLIMRHRFHFKRNKYKCYLAVGIDTIWSWSFFVGRWDYSVPSSIAAGSSTSKRPLYEGYTRLQFVDNDLHFAALQVSFLIIYLRSWSNLLCLYYVALSQDKPIPSNGALSRFEGRRSVSDILSAGFAQLPPYFGRYIVSFVYIMTTDPSP